MFVKNICLVIAICFLTSGFVKAQYANQQALYNNLPQARYYNPGIMPEYKGFFSIPLLSGVGSIASSSSFTIKDLFFNKKISSSSFLAKIEDKNILSSGFATDVIGFGFKKGKNFMSLNVTTKTDFSIKYSKDLFNFLINGNSSFSGEDILLVGTSFDMSSYIETGLGYSRELSSKLSVGGKFKFLLGVANVNANFNELELNRNLNDNTIKSSSDFSVNSYGRFLLDYNNTDELLINFGNLGFGIDLGANYRLSDKLQLFASIVDLGYLKWSEYGETFYNDGSTFSYDGSNLDQDSDFFSGILDSASTILDLKRNKVSYSTRLKTKFYVGGTYDLNKNFNFQGMLNGRVFNNKFYPMYMFAGGVKLSKWFTAKLSSSGVNGNYDNIGAGIVLHPGSFQLYAMMDNIYGLTRINNARHLAGSFGINFTFKEKENGKVKKAKKQKVKTEKASKSKKLSKDEKTKEIEK